MSAYLLLGFLTLLDLHSVVVSSVVSCGLSGTCTGPGGFGTETLGLALLLLPDPVGLWGLSFSWMTGCGFGTLGILCGDGGTGVGSAGCGSLGGMAAALGFSMVLADWMILEISGLGTIGAAVSQLLVQLHLVLQLPPFLHTWSGFVCLPRGQLSQSLFLDVL